jgi:hypothetical protein
MSSASRATKALSGALSLSAGFLKVGPTDVFSRGSRASRGLTPLSTGVEHRSRDFVELQAKFSPFPPGATR